MIAQLLASAEVLLAPADCQSGADTIEHVMMMQALPRKRALIINHENVTNCLYTGNQKNMLITNVLFRIGGACAIMSNRHASLPLVHAHTWCKLLRAPRSP